MDNWDRPFLRSMLSEQDGSVSSARFCIVLVVLVSLGWVTCLVLHDKKLPDLGQVGNMGFGIGFVLGGLSTVLIFTNRGTIRKQIPLLKGMAGQRIAKTFRSVTSRF